MDIIVTKKRIANRVAKSKSLKNEIDELKELELIKQKEMDTLILTNDTVKKYVELSKLAHAAKIEVDNNTLSLSNQKTSEARKVLLETDLQKSKKRLFAFTNALDKYIKDPEVIKYNLLKKKHNNLEKKIRHLCGSKMTVDYTIDLMQNSK